ncbi:MAG: hypothetical protein DMF86_22550, partial [Acidobacteria bacterium]
MQRTFLRFVLRRAVAAVVLVFVVASAALLLAQAAPGDYSARDFQRDPAALAAERHRLGLDRPFADQYATWLRRVVTLDLGESFRYRRPVLALVRE